MVKLACIFTLAFLAVSCDLFASKAKPEAVARVNESYLYKEDISNLLPDDVSKEDSVAIISNFINQWAKNKILISAAEINLNQKKQSQLDELVSQYKLDLYSKAYIEEIVKQSVDTIITSQEIAQYYKENKSNFKTNATLVRLRYIHLRKDNPKLATIRSKFFDFRKSDTSFWETNVLQFRNFALNDSVYVEMGQIYSKLPFINPDNRDTYIARGKSIEHTDGDLIYLVKITNVLDKNQIAPLQYLEPTMREVILNKRKLELIKKFEKDITDDAIKSKKYEIYK